MGGGRVFLAAKSSSSRLCNVWCVRTCSRQSSHTCPEALIKLSEFVNKYLLQFGHIFNLYSPIKYKPICNRYLLTNSISLINASGQV